MGKRAFGRGAKVDGKPLVDALAPCVDAWRQQNGNNLLAAFQVGAEAAVAGAAYTSTLAASLGRTGTVGERSIGYPDAGAHASGSSLRRYPAPCARDRRQPGNFPKAFLDEILQGSFIQMKTQRDQESAIKRQNFAGI